MPDYHLWTNKKRFVQFHASIKSSSKVLLGCNIPPKLIKRYYKGNYETINYKDADGFQLKITPKMITGHFRTAGTLAVAVAYSWNPQSRIFIAGMDGYTLYPKHQLRNKQKHQHCYGEGFTDDADWKACLKKDQIVHQALKNLKNYGINFYIITPTVFKEFYEKVF